MNRNLILAITGASGAVYAIRLLDVLLAAGHDVHLSISPAGQAVLAAELDLTVDLNRFDPVCLPVGGSKAPAPKYRALIGPQSHPTQSSSTLRYHHYLDLSAPIASGSFLTGGMVVCPCSGGTLSAIAQAASTSLIHRAADVQLKERRKLILVPRETPLSAIQLDNMKRATDAGAVVLPAMPGFYHGVTCVRDLVDFVVARICDQLGVEHRLMRRWGNVDIGNSEPGT